MASTREQILKQLPARLQSSYLSSMGRLKQGNEAIAELKAMAEPMNIAFDIGAHAGTGFLLGLADSTFGDVDLVVAEGTPTQATGFVSSLVALATGSDMARTVARSSAAVIGHDEGKAMGEAWKLSEKVS